MNPLFSEQPGRWERHVIRRWKNPLFAVQSDAMELQQAQLKDQQELGQFMDDFRELVQQVAELGDQAEAEDILKYKQRLDRAYERSAVLGGDKQEVQAMIRRLIDSISTTMARGMSTDFEAMDRMDKEQRAREIHFTMLEDALVADIICQDTPIGEDELVPVLLSEAEAAVEKALQLFSPEQLMLLISMAEQLLASLADDVAQKPALQQRIQLLQKHLKSFE